MRGSVPRISLNPISVAEAAVIGARDADKGQLPVALVVLKAGCERPEAEIVAELIAAVREAIGPVAAFKKAVIVERLPKTRSGKTVRATLRQIADGDEVQIPATIDDATGLDEIAERLATIGYGRQGVSS